jgi:hypothetical protein
MIERLASWARGRAVAQRGTPSERYVGEELACHRQVMMKHPQPDVNAIFLDASGDAPPLDPLFVWAVRKPVIVHQMFQLFIPE